MTEWWVKYKGTIPSAGLSFPEDDWLDLRSSAGYKLHTYRYPANNPRALIFIFHCLHSATSSYSHFAKKFAEQEFAVFGFDQPGHGRSEGPKGNIRDFDDLVNNGIEFISKTKEHYPDETPAFIIGESMGGTICIDIALRIPTMINGMILLAPALGVNPDLAPFLVKLVRCFAWCWSGMPLKGTDPNLACSNPINAQWWEENPDTYFGRLNAGTGAALLRGFEEVQDQIGNVTTPFILFQGGHDAIVNEQQAREFVKNSKVEDKEYAFYKEMYHAVSNEPQVYEIIDRILEWIQERV
ncbi:unnamed protein product [Blepharisma stoltei]|uniref:Serine aminopeptidase S33 domain-containing protein n=1 Tax=Blepharisma stoltei TaxID=1481888 RepID=A0AAU9IFT8_9CILI|nr:unnamed protein product [Blepharisma stoltei]